MKKPIRRTLKILGWLVGGLVILVVVAIGALVIWLSTSEPQIDGTVVVDGLSSPVQIVRDENYVTHIKAENPQDAYFALGYAHAQDRLPQMEQMRRLGAGRLSELIPAEFAIEFDKLTRTLGLYRLAEQAYQDMSPEAQAVLEAYAAGVNAYLDTHEGAWSPALYMRLPLSLDLDDYRPEPWRPADSLVWGKVMAIFLAGWNFMLEIERLQVEQMLGPELAAEFFPEYPGSEYGPTLPAEQQSMLLRDWRRVVAAIPEPMRTPWDASNAWVVDARHTDTGAPLLANDPHLRHSLPGTWYLTHLEAPGMNLVGGTTPGVPLIVVGHNGRIAWGFTTSHSDMADLFVERIDPDDPNAYLTPEGAQPFEVREETLHLANGETETFTVRVSRHGPIISDLRPEDTEALLDDDQVVALAAPYLFSPDRTAEGMLGINQATDWDGFVAAASLFNAPQQNMHYADVDGNIGLYAPAWVPIRAAGDGTVPSPGWTGEYDWTGRIPIEGLPRRLNPNNGVLVNANNRLVDDDYPYFLGHTYIPAYRSDRIHQMLAARETHDIASFQVMQHDTLSLEVAKMLPLYLDAEFRDPRARMAADMLRGWDGDMSADAAEPLIYAAWDRAMPRTLFADELTTLFEDGARGGDTLIANVFSGQDHWCDNVDTDAVEDCAWAKEQALLAGLDLLTGLYGDDMADWRWGAAHRADFRHQIFSMIPLIGGWLDASVETGGSGSTVMAGGTRGGGDAPFRNGHGGGFRAVYDLSDLGNSRFSMAPGQSDNPFSAYWAHLAEPWRDGVYFTIATETDAVGYAAIGRLILQPAAQ